MHAATSQHFADMENTVFHSLYTLIKDTSVLREYASAALQIVQVRRVGGGVE